MSFMDQPEMILAQQRSQMWGASLFSHPTRDAKEWLGLLAAEGIRAWVAPARSGSNGYLALIVHPDDLEAFKPGPILSGGRPSRERWVGAERFRLIPFWRSDFAPKAQSVADNVEQAAASARARQERQELERALGDSGGRRGSGRL